MKKAISRIGRIATTLAFGLALYAGVEYRNEILQFLHDRFPREGKAEEAVKPPGPLNPLPQQIASCRKERSGFQSCMFQAGYEVNSAWTSAHAAAGVGPKFGTAGEAAKDVYRAEPSPVYGVPYWVPRQPKK